MAVLVLQPHPAYAAALEVGSLAKAPVIDGDIGDAEWTGAGLGDQNFVQIERSRPSLDVNFLLGDLTNELQSRDPAVRSLAIFGNFFVF